MLVLILFCREINTEVCADDLNSSMEHSPVRTLSEDLFENLPVVRVWQERDILYNQPILYEAVPLDSLLKAAFPDIKDYAERDYTLVLRAKGGYEPIISLDAAMSGKAFVVRSIVGLDTEEGYPCWREAGQINCNPEYFVIWTDGYYPERPQPWGLFEVQLMPAQFLSQAIAPKDNSPEVSRGYTTYLKYCIECHNIGGVGGGVATDHAVRNRPVDRNLLRFFLFEFAERSPETSMPDFSGVLEQQDVSELQKYLKHMFMVQKESSKEASPD